MSSCQGCGSDSPADVKFCPSCGLPTAGEHSADSIAFIGASSVASEEGVRQKMSGRTVALAALAIWMAAVAWLFVGADDGSIGEAVSSEEQLLIEEAAQDADQAMAELLSEGEPSPGEIANEPAEGATAPGTLDSIHPLLAGGSTGYRLLATDNGRTVDINLDSGDVRRLNQSFQILGATETELVVFDPAVGFRAIPHDDLSQPGRVVFSIPEVSASEGRVSVDSLHTAALRLPSTIIVEFDASLSSPRQHDALVFEIDIELGSFAAVELENSIGLSPISRSEHGLMWIAGGGLFDSRGGSYQKLSNGYPLLLGVNHAIVQSCVRPDACIYEWIDRSTGVSTSQRTLPDLDGIWWIGEVDSRARVLLLEGPQGLAIYDVERDRLLTTLPPEVAGGSGRFSSGPYALSPDGRWLAYVDGSDVRVYDLKTDAQYEVDVLPSLAGNSLVFVPTP